MQIQFSFLEIWCLSCFYICCDLKWPFTNHQNRLPDFNMGIHIECLISIQHPLCEILCSQATMKAKVLIFRTFLLIPHFKFFCCWHHQSNQVMHSKFDCNWLWNSHWWKLPKKKETPSLPPLPGTICFGYGLISKTELHK